MKKKVILSITGAVLTAILLLGTARFDQSKFNNEIMTEATLAPVITGDGIYSEGEVIPGQKVSLAFASGGLIQQVLVNEGDQVKAGDVLIVSDSLIELQAALDASQRALASAQENYEHLMAYAPLTRANAQLALIEAQKAVDEAQEDTQSKQYQRASQETIDIARARLITANQALDDAEEAFARVSGRGEDDVNYAAGLDALAKARQNQITAQYNLNYVQGLPEPLDIEKAETRLDIAQATLLAAKADWELVKDEPRDIQMVAAQAEVVGAQAALSSAQAALDRAVIRAPFDGTIVDVTAKPGQLVTAGQGLVSLADLSTLQIETIDLSEMDIPQVEIGQTAIISIDSLGLDIPARVEKINYIPGKNSGEIVYTVTLQPDTRPDGLRWGMSATVHILPINQ